MVSKWSSYLIVPALLFYVASLTQPALYCAGWGDAQGPRGIQLLMTGWFGVADLEFRWFGNVLFWMAVWFHARPLARGAVERRGGGFGLLAFSAWTYLTPIEACGVQHLSAISGFGIGAHLWAAALATAGLSRLAGWPLREVRAPVQTDSESG